MDRSRKSPNKVYPGKRRSIEPDSDSSNCRKCLRLSSIDCVQDNECVEHGNDIYFRKMMNEGIDLCMLHTARQPFCDDIKIIKYFQDDMRRLAKKDYLMTYRSIKLKYSLEHSLNTLRDRFLEVILPNLFRYKVMSKADVIDFYDAARMELPETYIKLLNRPTVTNSNRIIELSEYEIEPKDTLESEVTSTSQDEPVEKRIVAYIRMYSSKDPSVFISDSEIDVTSIENRLLNEFSIGKESIKKIPKRRFDALSKIKVLLDRVEEGQQLYRNLGTYLNLIQCPLSRVPYTTPWAIKPQIKLEPLDETLSSNDSTNTIIIDTEENVPWCGFGVELDNDGQMLSSSSDSLDLTTDIENLGMPLITEIKTEPDDNFSDAETVIWTPGTLTEHPYFLTRNEAVNEDIESDDDDVLNNSAFERACMSQFDENEPEQASIPQLDENEENNVDFEENVPDGIFESPYVPQVDINEQNLSISQVDENEENVPNIIENYDENEENVSIPQLDENEENNVDSEENVPDGIFESASISQVDINEQNLSISQVEENAENVPIIIENVDENEENLSISQVDENAQNKMNCEENVPDSITENACTPQVDDNEENASSSHVENSKKFFFGNLENHFPNIIIKQVDENSQNNIKCEENVADSIIENMTISQVVGNSQYFDCEINASNSVIENACIPLPQIDENEENINCEKNLPNTITENECISQAVENTQNYFDCDSSIPQTVANSQNNCITENVFISQVESTQNFFDCESNASIEQVDENSQNNMNCAKNVPEQEQASIIPQVVENSLNNLDCKNNIPIVNETAQYNINCKENIADSTSPQKAMLSKRCRTIVKKKSINLDHLLKSRNPQDDKNLTLNNIDEDKSNET